jgi:DNA-binding winged helix-turn-helix (wHTH) protein
MPYSFDDYTLAAEHIELRQAGRLVRLAPRVFNLLAYLVQHRGRIVTNEELKEQLCPKREVVGEASLANAAAQARKALGDTGQVQRYIQTVHRRDYRFVVPVTARPPGATDLLDATCPDTPQPPVMPLLDQADTVSPFAPGPSASPAAAMPMLPTVTLPTVTTSDPRSAAALETPEDAWRPLTELAHPYSLAMVQFQAACLHHHRRDVPAIQAHAEALLTLATDQGFPLFVGHGTYLQG